MPKTVLAEAMCARVRHYGTLLYQRILCGMRWYCRTVHKGTRRGLGDCALDRLRIPCSPTKFYAWRRTMDTPGEKCFVEQFHLRSPIEEFEDYSHEALEQLRNGNRKSDEATYREAMALVFRKLRPNGARAIQSRSRSDTP